VIATQVFEVFLQMPRGICRPQRAYSSSRTDVRLACRADAPTLSRMYPSPWGLPTQANQGFRWV
jgi:hypothetical protein